MTYRIRLIALILVGVMGGCAYDPSGSAPYYSGANNNGSYNNGSNYPYNAYNTRYPSQGYETEYRKAQQNINSTNSQAIIDGITQRMLNGGWYPEGMSGNQLIFTRVREQNNQNIFYKTVYTLVPSGTGYKVYANMKLKTTDQGSLNDAARNVDDRTESILKSVKKSVEQKPMSVTPMPTKTPMMKTPYVKTPYTNTQTVPFSNDSQPIPVEQQSVPIRSVPENVQTQSVVKPDMNKLMEQTSTVRTVPTEMNVIDQQEQSNNQFNNQQNTQQNKQDKAQKRKEQNAENKKEKHTKQEDGSRDKESTVDENTTTPEPAESQ